MPERRWSSPHGEVLCRDTPPQVLVFELRGHLDASVVPRIGGAIDAVTCKGLVPEVFFDATDLVGYETDFRRAMTALHKRVQPVTRANHVLVRSKIVAMGVSVANLALRQALTPHSSRGSFDAALREALARAA